MEDDIILNEFKKITELKGHDQVELVFGIYDKKVYVRKYLEIYNFHVYQKLSELENIHIPRIYECKIADGRLCIVEEYISGETLYEKAEKGVSFSERETFDIVLQVCDALEYLHGQIPPIIHRDIKLSNIMITQDGIVKLIDYNAARHYEEGIERDTVFIGTIGYAAPEQYGFLQTDMRADIYSLGVLMNYMLTGHSLQEKRYEGRYQKVIQKCTCFAPENRYQNVQELRHDLIRSESLTAGGKKEKRFLPPGFRTGKKWKMLTAILGYGFIFYFLAGMEVEGGDRNQGLRLLNQVCLGGGVFFALALIFNYMGIHWYFPLTNSHKHWKKRLGVIVWSVLGFVLAAFICTVMELIFFG